jgi:hypothetical protein
MLAAILTMSYLVIWQVGVDGIKGVALFEHFFDSIKNNTLFNDVTPYKILLYGLGLFLVINIVLLFALLIMLLLCLGNFSKAVAFYSISVWFFLGAMIYTGAVLYLLIANGFVEQIRVANHLAWIPVAAAFVLMVLGWILKGTERRYK